MKMNLWLLNTALSCHEAQSHQRLVIADYDVRNKSTFLQFKFVTGPMSSEVGRSCPKSLPTLSELLFDVVGWLGSSAINEDEVGLIQFIMA